MADAAACGRQNENPFIPQDMVMAIFDELCIGFCDVLQRSPPSDPVTGEHGAAFHLTVSGVTVDVMHIPDQSHAHVFVFFTMGSIASGDSREMNIQRALLEANFMVAQPWPMVFSRHPQTGDAVLKRVYPLDMATPEGLATVVEEGVELALRWRDDFFLREASADETSVSIPAFA